MGREDIEVLHGMLSADQRRQALAVLTDAEEPLDRDELARRIVARRAADEPGDDESNEARTTEVEISLSHVHLPKLEAGGIVQRTGEETYDVTPLGDDLGRAARAFESYLGADTRNAEDGAAASTASFEAVPASDYDGDAK